MRHFSIGRKSIYVMALRFMSQLVPWLVGAALIGGTLGDSLDRPYFTESPSPLSFGKTFSLLGDRGEALGTTMGEMLLIGLVLQLFVTAVSLGLLQGGSRGTGLRPYREGLHLMGSFFMIALGALFFVSLGGLGSKLLFNIIEKQGLIHGWTALTMDQHSKTVFALFLSIWGMGVGALALETKVRVGLGKRGIFRAFWSTLRHVRRKPFGTVGIYVAVSVVLRVLSFGIILFLFANEARWPSAGIGLILWGCLDAFLWHGLLKGAFHAVRRSYSK